MKIVFFSHDDELEEFLQEAVTSADVVMTDAEDDALSEVDEALEEEIPVALFLDFDTTRKSSEKLNKHYLKDKEVARIVFTESMSVKELKKHQDSKLGATAYMRKPLTAESISELLQDIGLTDEAIFEYESDDLFESVPAGSGSDTHQFDDEDSSESEINFSAAELKMDTAVRYQLDRHNFNPDKAFDFENEMNLKIQAAFDLVFDTPVDKTATNSQSLNAIKPGAGLHEEDDETSAEEDDQSIVFDFGGDADNTDAQLSTGEQMSSNNKVDEDELEETGETLLDENPRDILEQMESEREASLVGYRPPSLDATGDIEIPDEFRTQKDESDSDSDGLEFDIPEEQAAVDEELNFDMEGDDAGGFSLGDGDDSAEQSADQSESEGALDLDMSDDGALEFGQAQGDDNENEELSAQSDAEEIGGLDLGEDAGELELGSGDDSLEGDDGSTGLDDDDFGGLDLSDGDEDEDIGKTVVMNAADAGLNFGMPSDDADESVAADISDSSELDFNPETSDTSLSAIDDELLGEMSEAEEVNIEDALTGVTQDELQEFDYTGANDIAAESDSLDDDEFADLTGLDESDDAETEATLLAGAPRLQSLTPEMEEEDNPGFSVSAEHDVTGVDLSDNDDFLGGDDDEDVEAQLTSKSTPKNVASKKGSSSHESRDPILVQTYAQEEMVRHQGLIRQLREEREDLLKQIQELKTSMRMGESENLGLRAELDELKIEKSIMKKRHHQEMEELRYSVKLAEEKREIFEERARKVQKEFDKLNHKVRIDFNTVKQREKELEGQLELLKMDSQSQVESRDKKILELKRKIDALEFNMENAHIKEQKSKEDKVKLEDKLHKVMKTLRSSIKVMEDDLEIDHLLSSSHEDAGENETSE